MKIVCINNENCEDELTIGKSYDVIFEGYNYMIINDNGYKWWCIRSWFKSLLEIRNEKINKLLDDESKMCI